MASSLVNVSGSSRCFERGVVTYSNESKQELLSVPEDVLIKHGAVSAECARFMAKSIKDLSGSDFGVSTTGISGPQGGTSQKPVGTTYIGICTKEEELTEHFIFKKSRNKTSNS